MKKGSTLVNFAMIIGLIFILIIVLFSMQKLIFGQAKNIEFDAANNFGEEIKTTVEKANAFPSDAQYLITLSMPEEYQFEVSQHTLAIRYPQKDIFVKKNFFVSQSYIIPNTFASAGKIYVFKKGGNILVTDKLSCSAGDTFCNPSCIINHVCNTACYDESRDGICNQYCIAKSPSCIEACYSNVNKGGFYDPKCIQSGDGICDPATSNVVDGICDTDCLGTNGVCDPDCTDPANPLTFDTDCPHQGNGKCEPDLGENCDSTSDCNCIALGKGLCCSTCADTDPVDGCCPIGTTPCAGKCVPNSDPGKADDDACSADCECSSNNCGVKKNLPSSEKHCCSTGKKWDGTKCAKDCAFMILFVQFNSVIDDFDNKARSGRDTWASLSPLRDCPDSVCYEAATGICSAPASIYQTGQIVQNLQNCASIWGYGGKYTRIVGVFPGSCVFTLPGGGCVGGFSNFGADYLVSSETYISSVTSHEMGHTFGLCDEGYGIGTCSISDCSTGWCGSGGTACYTCNDPQCNSVPYGCGYTDLSFVKTCASTTCCPNTPESGSIMCSWNRCGTPCSGGGQFGSTSFSYLSTISSLKCS